MSPEVNISSKALAVRFNGVFSPTDKGHLAHELVRIHKVLRNVEDPKAQFSMRPDLVQSYKSREEELCSQLGLPSDKKKREKIIKGYNGYLCRVGLPYYKINI